MSVEVLVVWTAGFRKFCKSEFCILERVWWFATSFCNLIRLSQHVLGFEYEVAHSNVGGLLRKHGWWPRTLVFDARCNISEHFNLHDCDWLNVIFPKATQKWKRQRLLSDGFIGAAFTWVRSTVSGVSRFAQCSKGYGSPSKLGGSCSPNNLHTVQF